MSLFVLACSWSVAMSSPKVENVVNAPSTPPIQNNRVASESCALDKNPSRRPIQKHPIKLMMSVCIGKFDGGIFMSVSRYLMALPMAPPIMTVRRCFIVYFPSICSILL